VCALARVRIALCRVQSLSSSFYFLPGVRMPAEGVRVMSGFRVWSLGFSLESRFRFCGFVWGLGFAV
jgi:hypothetical protein